MAKTKISEFSSTPANNTDIDSINIAEGCAPSGINDAIRELMSQLKDWQSGTSNDPYVVGSSGSLTLNQGTANGVAYLNGSKVVTSGSGLVFDGANLGVGVSPTVPLHVTKNGADSGFGFYVISKILDASTNKGLQIGYDNSTQTTVLVANTSTAVAASTSMSFWTWRASGDGWAERMRVDSLGHLGLGVIPSAWSNVFKTLEGPYGGALSFYASSNFPSTFLASNAYNNGTNWIAKVTDQAGLYKIEGTTGKHIWSTVTSDVTAGNTISFNDSMTLDSGGRLLVNLTSAPFSTWKMTVDGGSNDSFGSITNNASSLPFIAWNKTTSGDNAFAGFYTEGTITFRGSIVYNRASGLVVYGTTSDYRAKDISGPLTGSGALIDSVPVYMGKMKGATQERPMFIAHETPDYAHTGVKDAVDKNGNPVYQQMDASALIPVMWAEIQSLRQRLAAANL